MSNPSSDVTSRNVTLPPQKESSNPNKPIGFAVAIIFGVGSFGVFVVGVGGFFQVGALSNLNQIAALVMMPAGGVGSIAGFAVAIILAKKKPPTKLKSRVPITPPKTTTISQPEPTTPPKPEPKKETPKRTNAERPFVYAPEGLNQFVGSGPSACTRIACRFLALTPDKPATEEDIQRAIVGHGYSGNTFEDPDKVIALFPELEFLEINPWWEETNTHEIQADIYGRTGCGISEAMNFLLTNPDVNGILITGQGTISIALRRQGDKIEIFDSHGHAELSKANGNVAYVHRCDPNQAIQFLEKRFPKVEGMEDSPQFSTVSFFPIKIKRS
jgi:hypothetical protein